MMPIKFNETSWKSGQSLFFGARESLVLMDSFFWNFNNLRPFKIWEVNVELGKKWMVHMEFSESSWKNAQSLFTRSKVPSWFSHFFGIPTI